jgi:hypothetical protein
MDVYLERKKTSTNDNNTTIIVFQGRSDNGQSIHSWTPTDTSTIQEQRVQMGKT